MSRLPPTSEENARYSPSADQAGAITSGPRWKVTCCGLDPSALATQISFSPVRFEANATRSPRGDTAGKSSNQVEPAISFSSRRPGSHRQMLTSRMSDWYARRIGELAPVEREHDGYAAPPLTAATRL